MLLSLGRHPPLLCWQLGAFVYCGKTTGQGMQVRPTRHLTHADRSVRATVLSPHFKTWSLRCEETQCLADQRRTVPCFRGTCGLLVYTMEPHTWQRVGIVSLLNYWVWQFPSRSVVCVQGCLPPVAAVLPPPSVPHCRGLSVRRVGGGCCLHSD